MVTLKNFRLGAVAELVGMALFFLYYTWNLPFLSISAVNMMGETKTTYIGFQEICMSSVRGSEWIGWMFSLAFILIVVLTAMKGFIRKKTAVVYLHNYSTGAMALFAFFFTIVPFFMAPAESYGIEHSLAGSYLQNISVVPCILVFPFGLYFVVTAFFSYKRLFQCYDECPKLVARFAWPFFKRTWLERHYGKKEENGIGMNEESFVESARQRSTNEQCSSQEQVEISDSSESRKKYYMLGGALVLTVLAVLFFCLKGEEDVVEVVNIPAIKETYYVGRIGKVEVEMRLTQENDSLYGTYFYKRNKQDIQLSGKIEEGRHVIDEFVGGKNTGTFQLDLWEYDGQLSLSGKWSNGKKTFDVFLEDKMNRIIPSADAEHPFVGEWTSAEGAKYGIAILGLYNKDIRGHGYGFFTIESEKDFVQYQVGSVLQLNGNTAVLDMGEEKFTLTCNPSDRSLQIETEKSGSFLLFLDRRGLDQRLDDWAAMAPPPEIPLIPETVTVIDDNAETETSEEQSSIPYVEEEDDATAGKAPSQAELETELYKEVENPDKIYDNVEVMPEYPGGYIAMVRYITQNMKYPMAAQKNGTQGKVVVGFVVDRDGSIINAHVLIGLDSVLDEEALRIIKSMPRWTPGKLNGNPVRVNYKIPITFKLS